MSKDYKTVWKKCLEIIKDNLSEENSNVFETWFAPITPIELKDNTLTIHVPSLFYCEWLDTHYSSLLSKAIKSQLGVSGKLNYSASVDNSVSNDPITTTVPQKNANVVRNKSIYVPYNINRDNNRELPNPFILPGIRRTNINSQLNESYTLENFVEGKCNSLARSAGYAIAKKPGTTSFNPLFIHGKTGLGKTHLAHAIGIKTKELYPDKTVLYVTSDQFLQQYAEAGQNRTTGDFIHFYEMIDVLIVDDIQFWANRAPGTQEAFFHIFNHLHQKNNQIIITSDKAPAELEGLESRLLSRLKWGLAANLQVPDTETRKAILNQKLANDGIEMPEDVIEYLAYSINTNVRELEGVLVALIAQSSLNKTQITQELAKQMIDTYVKNNAQEITIEYIQKVVCDYFNIPIESMLSKTRKRDIVQARQLSMYFAKKITKESLTTIGQKCGNKDHATVLHSCKTVENLIQSDRMVNGYVEDLSKKFNL